MKDSVGQREFNKVPCLSGYLVKKLTQLLSFNPLFHLSQGMQRLILELANAGHVPKHLSVHLPQGFRQLSGSRSNPCRRPASKNPAVLLVTHIRVQADCTSMLHCCLCSQPRRAGDQQKRSFYSCGDLLCSQVQPLLSHLSQPCMSLATICRSYQAIVQRSSHCTRACELKMQRSAGHLFKG